MRFIADLHIHSRFSRATSRGLSLREFHVWAQRKGIRVLGAGDVTHPAWIEEIAGELEPAEPGLFRLRPDLAQDAHARVPPACRGEVRFLLQGEISGIYKHDGSVRKVHNLVYCPDLPAARRLLASLDRLGNIRSDGRPILGLSSRDLLEVVLEAGPGCHLVPAHVWTPWFSLLGSKSGYDSVEACFGDLSEHVFALETGLSSDPAMNWRVSGLDRYALISNSDAHSAANLGREANEFDLDPSYQAIFESLRRPGDPGFVGTLEFFPEEGKYHLDGHRKCGRRLTPEETKAAGGRCPTCGEPVTVGVLHRVEELADRPHGISPPRARPFRRLVPLPEVVAECLGVGAQSKRVGEVCGALLERLGPELFILRDAPLEDVNRLGGGLIAEALRRVREGTLQIAAGYDGEFGTVRIFTPEERSELGRQGLLFPDERAPGGSAAAQCPADPCRAAAGAEASRAEAAARPASVEPREAEEVAAPILSGLNQEQREAVLASPGPLLIVAGPGTGKTRTLTHRIASKILSGQVSPERALALTFTRRAAEEMRGRLSGLLGPELGGRVLVTTLHRLGLALLREEAAAAGLPSDFRVLGETECLALVRETTGLGLREARAALGAISLARRGGPRTEGVSTWLPDYEAALARVGGVDLDDLILRSAGLLEADASVRQRWQGRFDHLAVDEFQDLDPVQYRLVGLLAPGPFDVTVIGDPDQSIYGFRGADPELFRRFREERPGAARVALTLNYRSTPTIVEAASQLLAGGGQPSRTELVAFLAEGPLVRRVDFASDRAEADFVAQEVERLVGGTSHLSLRGNPGRGTGEVRAGFEDVAVLYRLKAQRPLLEAALDRSGIPYRVVGEEPQLLRGKGKKVLERLRKRPGGEPAAEGARAALEGLRVDPGSLLAQAWRAAAAGAGDVAELLDAVALRTPDDDFDPRSEKVTLLTLHAAKGLEFPAVFLTGCEEGLMPYLRDGEGGLEPRIAEERRLLYVGMTRARNLLYLTWALRRRIHGKSCEQLPSRFLSDIGEALLEARPFAATGDEKGQPKGRQLRLL